MTMLEAERPYMTGEWVDAAGLREWLRAEGVLGLVPETTQRNTCGERAARPLEVWEVDETLTALGYHLSDLPDELWVAPPPPFPARKPNAPLELRKKAVAMYGSGMSAPEVAKQLGVARASVYKWAEMMALPPAPELDPWAVAYFFREHPNYAKGIGHRDKSRIAIWAREGKRPQTRTVVRLLKDLDLNLDALPASCWVSD